MLFSNQSTKQSPKAYQIDNIMLNIYLKDMVNGNKPVTYRNNQQIKSSSTNIKFVESTNLLNA